MSRAGLRSDTSTSLQRQLSLNAKRRSNAEGAHGERLAQLDRERQLLREAGA